MLTMLTMLTLMFVPTGKRDRRRLGRPQNPNRAPADTAVRIRKTALDEIDRLVNIPRMPLGLKIESLIAEVKNLRKKVIGEYATSNNLSPNTISVNNVYDNNTIESYDSNWSPEELEILKQEGWDFKA